MIDNIYKFIQDFFIILAQMAPYLLLGFFFAGLLHAFIPKHKIEQYFGSGSVLKSSVLASLFGIPLPLCSCGVIPTGMAFYKNGASKSATVSFLISTPQTGVDSILASLSLLGLPLAIIRPIASLVTGVFGGVVTGIVDEGDKQQSYLESNHSPEGKTISEKLRLMFKYGFVHFIQDISKWLVVGLVLAALVSALVPDNFFNVLNIAPIYQMFLILIVAIPMYICATGTIPLAAILMLKGLSPGAAFVLLMAGPATNMATITMITKVMGRKTLFSYLGSIILGALIFALIIDYALPAEWFEMAMASVMHNHNHVAWWEIGSAIILVILMINGAWVTYKNQNNTVTTESNNDMEKTIIRVDGMTCNHCKATVEKNVGNLPFVSAVSVNLSEKTASIEGDNIDIEQVKETLTSIGFTPVG